MSIDLKVQYQEYYSRMFSAHQAGDTHTANQFRDQMEELRRESISMRQLPAIEIEKFPSFVRSTLNKKQSDLGIDFPSNCINAALNFLTNDPVFEPYSAMDFLNVIQTNFRQLESKCELDFGDLVVCWSRSSDDWEKKGILIEALDPSSPGFPFGLVFDHVAVFVGENCLFHKPDPTFNSCYQINHWDDIVGFSEVVDGFELTFHRKS